MKFKRCLDTDGTSLKGYVSATYSDLFKVFGKPQFGPNDPDEDKVTCEWNLKSPDGVIFTIYDWKEERTPLDVYDWHIGGFTPDAVKVVEEALRISNTR